MSHWEDSATHTDASGYDDEGPIPRNGTIESFIEKHGIRFECRRVDSRPDGLMDGDGQRHFRCRVISREFEHVACKVEHCGGYKSGHLKPRSFGLYFSQGSAHTSDPTLADVLDCLASDASGYENARVRPDGAYHTTSNVNSKHYDTPMHFHNWAEEYGYDTDSRKAEKTFRAVKRQSEQLKRTIGNEAYQELLWNVERL